MTRKPIFILIGCVFIMTILYTGYSMAADKGREYYEQAGEVLWEIKTEEKIVALTFDDGPDSKYTVEILELLESYDAKATFFVIGESAEKHPEVILQAHNAGHELANHTYTHSLRLLTVAKLEEELKRTNETIYSITGEYPLLFRPVGGQYTEEMINTAVKNGYKVVMWSWHQDTEDWKNPGARKIVKKVLKGTEPGNIILFHDGGGNRSQTVKALEEILPELQKQGYKFVTVTDLIDIKNREIKK